MTRDEHREPHCDHFHDRRTRPPLVRGPAPGLSSPASPYADYWAEARASRSLASFSWHRLVLMRVPPYGWISAKTLSGVIWRISTHRAAVPGLSVSPRLFMKLSSMPTSRKAPETAPAAAPMAMPNSGLRKSRPMSAPQKPPLTAPAAVRLYI